MPSEEGARMHGASGPRAQLASRVAIFAVWAISVIVDCLFLAIWIVTQWGIEQLEPLLRSTLHAWLFDSFEIAFGVSTLCPVLIYIYVDLRIMAIQASAAITEQRRPQPFDSQP